MIHGSWRRSRSCGGCLPIALCVAVAGCTPGPAIRSFQVEPRARCGPGEATLRWRATQDGRLESEPPVVGLGEVPSSGVKTVTVRETTVFKLSVGDARPPKFTRGEVHVISPDMPEPFQAPAEDCNDDTLLAGATVSEIEWPAEILVTSVESDALRPVRVSHGGTTATLQPSVASDAFRGLPYRGDWTLEMDGTGEECADAPTSLFLAISLGCAR